MGTPTAAVPPSPRSRRKSSGSALPSTRSGPINFWKKQDKLEAALYHQVGIAVSARFFKIPAVGSMAKLVHRLRQLLAGHAHGTSAKLPQLPDPGPPPGGPDLSTFVVGPFDFTGEAAVNDQGYDVDPAVVSTYGIRLLPAGPFDEVQQTIDWYANDNVLTWQGTLFDDTFFGGSDSGRTPVDLSAVGDNAHGLMSRGSPISRELRSPSPS
jgi:hypothetical protein